MTDFSALYGKYSRDVFRFAYYLCGNRGEAEDITSATFVRAFASPERIEMATMKGYLLTIARNLFLHGARKKKRHIELTGEYRDPRPGPEDEAAGRSELRVVLERLHELPEIDRAAVVMRAVEEMPYEEISRALGVPVATLKVKIHRARLALAGIRRGKE